MARQNHRAQCNVEAHLEKRVVRKLATALRQNIRIPETCHLAVILGDSSEKDNTDALVTWISAKLAGIGNRNERGQHEYLKRALAEELGTAPADCSYN